jgi:Transposase IS66 family
VSLSHDGRIEIDSNTVERSIRGPALTRKNALCSSDDVLRMEEDFGEDPEISGALIAWHLPGGAQISPEGRKVG